MNKIVQINVDDIVIDPEAMSDMLTECLKRRRMVRLAGACDIGGRPDRFFRGLSRPCKIGVRFCSVHGRELRRSFRGNLFPLQFGFQPPRLIPERRIPYGDCLNGLN